MRQAADPAFNAYHRIKHGIIDLTYRPGGKLSETRLSEELGVGRSPIRTALARLQGEGWIEIAPQSGTFVRSLSAREIGELSELRGILEAHCIGLTVERVSDRELRDLSDGFREFGPRIRRGDAAAFITLDRSLHALSCRMAGNELIAQTLTGLNDKVQWIRRACAVSEERVLEGFAEIEAIHQALLRRNATVARRRMRQHIENAARFCQTRAGLLGPIDRPRRA